MDFEEMEKEMLIIESKKNEILKDFKKILSSSFLESMKNGNIKKIRWHQFIPGFNDGEPCLFTMGSPEFLLEKDFANKYNFELIDGDQEELDLNWYCSPWQEDKSDKTLKDFSLIEKVFSIDESYFQDTFEPNTQITFDGDDFDIEDYDCGY